ncbi:hypothetical protein NLI96_g1571 [Meripilus lineatus]|uniref:DUF7918 domain-containing protein n=1 Tax=Meripilus lineatus TaxID=2056292 RepID=A0AAD5YMQ0_9APHY|nr:hypothetical protein NLI96_g1571 [Physisporinus lineatus]
MITHRGFSAWISSEGQSLRSYEPTLDNRENKVSCWIPSSEGKTFTVHWRDNGGGIDTAAYIYLDGFVVPGHFLYGSGEAERSGIRSSPIHERPFTFAKVGRGSRNTSGTPSSSGTGSIILKIKRVKRQGLHPPNALQPPPDASRRGNKRRMDHCVSYGQSKETRNQVQTTWSFEPYDPANPRSYVTFEFRYRPAEFLVDQGIMSAAEWRNANRNRIQQDTPPVTPYPGGQELFSLPDDPPTPTQESFNHYQNFFVPHIPQWDPSPPFYPANGVPMGNFSDGSFQASSYTGGDVYTGNFSAASSSVGTFSAAGPSEGTYSYSTAGPSMGTYSAAGSSVGTYPAAGSSVGTFSAAGSSMGTFSADNSSAGTYSAGTYPAGDMSYQGHSMNYNNSTYSFS